MTETIFASVAVLICIAPLVILGIIQYNSKSPVGFWSGKEPPQKEEITDIKAYNHKHGMMWILYGSGMGLGFIAGFPFGGEIAAIVLVVVCVGGLFGMIGYHDRLNRIYLRRQ